MSAPNHPLHQPANSEDRRLQRAIQRHQAGDLREAARLYREILAHDPRNAEANHLLGLAFSQQGKYEEARRSFRQAVSLDSGNATYQYNLAEAYRRLGQLDQAAAAYRQAIILGPDFAEAHYGFANVLKAMDRTEDAIAQYKAVLQIQPGHYQAFYNLGNTFLGIGQFRTAISCYQAAVALQPDYPEAHNNLGVAFKELDEIDEAITAFKQSIAIQPNFVEARRNLGQAFEKQGRLAEAVESYKAVLALEPEDDLFRLSVETTCPIIPASNEAIRQYWSGLEATLTRCLERDTPLSLDGLNRLDGIPPSTMVYHGRDERAFKERWARLFAGRLAEDGTPSHSRPANVSRSPAATASDNESDKASGNKPGKATSHEFGKPHIGFVVTHGHEGVFLKCMRGILNHLSGDDFRLTVLCSRQAGPQILGPAIANPAVRLLPLANHLPQAVEQVREAELDVLHYWEVGTDGMNYFLPFYDLAPVQCATWGWPVTSGIPTLDYYLSAELLETVESDVFYSEKLVRLRHLPTYYYRPIAPAPLKSRAQLGFGRHDHLYLCPQNLRKVQPDFDELVAALLRLDTRGIVLFIDDAQPAITELLRRRVAAVMPDVASRVRFLPRVPEADYLNLVAVADVVLDTLHYGGGANTTYDALSMGTPIVTLPGRFHRGRWTYAAYQRIGVTDCIADSVEAYVAIAARLAQDADWRQDVSARIAAACPVLFEDMGAVEELAAFFRSARANVKSR